jgi:hypothetical protein
VKKKKKLPKRINTFNNWLLARDSSSRISTFPEYQSFLENLNPELDYKRIMKIFDAVSGSLPFVKMHNYFDFGTMKNSRDNLMNIRFGKRDERYDIRHFISIFNPEPFKYCKAIFISANPDINDSIIKIENELIHVEIPYQIQESINLDKDIIPISSEIFKKWISLLDIEKGYKENFFKWWLDNGIFKEGRWESRFKYIEVALVEWMKVCNPDDAKNAYVKLNMKKDLSSTEQEVLDHVEQGIKEFNLFDLSDLQKGTSLIKRFGIDD